MLVFLLACSQGELELLDSGLLKDRIRAGGDFDRDSLASGRSLSEEDWEHETADSLLAEAALNERGQMGNNSEGFTYKLLNGDGCDLTDALNDDDNDGDGLSYELELSIGTSDCSMDSDNDGHLDYLDPFPALTDADQDGIDDDLEASCGTYSTRVDSDTDGVDDYDECFPVDFELSLDSCSTYTPPTSESVAVNVRCRAAPEIEPLDAIVEWQWVTNPIFPTWHQIISTPMVGNITDDNGDGLINELDVPDIVFAAHQTSDGADGPGKIVAISGDGSGTHWAVDDPEANAQMSASAMVALGDFEGDGIPELCYPGMDVTLVCLDARDGSFLLKSQDAIS